MKKTELLFYFLLLNSGFCFSQNVGIGTANPAAKLHTVGSIRFDTLSGSGLRPVFADALGNITTSLPALPPSTITNSASSSIPDFSCVGAGSNIVLSQLPSSVPSSTIKVTVNITHPKLQDLTIYLIEPNGKVINLFVTTANPAANLVNTVFTDMGSSLTTGTAPYTGNFRAAGDLTPSICGITPNVAFFAAMGTSGFIDPNGTWALRVIDNTSTNAGTLNNWTLSVDPGTGIDGIWGLKGNAGISQNNFIGTVDNAPLNFRVNNRKAGVIDSALANTAFGFRSLESVTTGANNTATGSGSLYSNTLGNYNVANGTSALHENATGGNNTANGYSALYFNTTGNYNVANGANALYSNTEGEYNAANGANALHHNTTGRFNVANGNLALYTNSTGNNNVANGANALYANTTGSGNVANGSTALFLNTTGGNNVANGNLALSSNNTGNYNAANGAEALYSNSSGSYNVANGYSALRSNSTGFANAANGTNALYSNSTGAYNVANGSSALYHNTTGGYNVANGYTALFNNSTGNYNVANGYGALLSNTTGEFNTATGVNSLNRNTTAGYNVANGYASLYSNTTGLGNTAVGTFALYGTTASNYNTTVGYHAGRNYNMGFNNTIIGANCDLNQNGLFNCIAIGQAVTNNASNQARIGNSGTLSIGGYANWTNISDGRYKKDIKEDVKGIDFIMKLKPVTYHLDVSGLSKSLDEGRGKELDNHSLQAIGEKGKIIYSGFVAQDVEKAAQETGYDFSGVDRPKNEKDFYGLRYAEFVVPLVKAVQELSIQNTGLKNQIDEQKKIIEDLLGRLKVIESSFIIKK